MILKPRDRVTFISVYEAKDRGTIVFTSSPAMIKKLDALVEQKSAYKRFAQTRDGCIYVIDNAVVEVKTATPTEPKAQILEKERTTKAKKLLAEAKRLRLNRG